MAGLKLITIYFYILSCFFRAQSFALPVDSTSSAGSPLLHPTLELTGTPGNLQSQMSLYHVVDNLLRWLGAQQNIRYHAAVLQTVACQIGGNPPYREPTLSNDVRRFRRCLCVFRYGGPAVPYPDPNGFEVENQWPRHWERWGAPEPEVVGNRFRGSQWQQAWGRMSLQRADRLLKDGGYRENRYGQVMLVKIRDRPLGWCFSYVEVGQGRSVAVNVEVLTGRVVEIGPSLACAGAELSSRPLAGLTQ